MNDQTDILDQADEEILTFTVSDDALERSAADAVPGRTMVTFIDRPGCGGTC